ncbi:hypothetical protein JB92DRAFT_2834458 [Gautieria morchelliformis]|nr:hypothetical protein JB92DRAFT_2834458 [Gautieria morchelliformis]
MAERGACVHEKGCRRGSAGLAPQLSCVGQIDCWIDEDEDGRMTDGDACMMHIYNTLIYATDRTIYVILITSPSAQGSNSALLTGGALPPAPWQYYSTKAKGIDTQLDHLLDRPHDYYASALKRGMIEGGMNGGVYVASLRAIGSYSPNRCLRVDADTPMLPFALDPILSPAVVKRCDVANFVVPARLNLHCKWENNGVVDGGR